MLAIDDLAGLIDLVQAGVVEIHPWGSRVDASGAAGPADLRSRSGRGRAVERGASRPRSEVRERLASCSASKSFVKTSGGKGLHVVVPIEPRARLGRGQGASPSRSPRRMAKRAARPLRRHHDQARAARAHLRRLSAQRPRRDRGRRLFDPRAAAGLGLDAARLGRAVGGHALRSFHASTTCASGSTCCRRDPWGDFFKLRQRIPHS